MIVFSNKDTLPKGVKIEEIIKTVPQCVQDLILACDNRYLAVNSITSSKKRKERQRNNFLSIVDDMYKRNEKCFTSEIYESAFTEMLELLKIQSAKGDQSASMILKDLRKALHENSDYNINKGFMEKLKGWFIRRLACGYSVEEGSIGQINT